jgi:hypothetical protein
MSKWRVSVQWDTEVEAADEGTALDVAYDQEFSFYKEAEAEWLDFEDEEE